MWTKDWLSGLRSDPQSIHEANSLIWSSLNDVCTELGIPFEKSMYWNYHPDVDGGLRIVDRENRVYGGETVVAHEMRHLTEPAEQGKRFMVLDFYLGGGKLSWSTATAISEAPQKIGNTIECFLAPLYPSSTDIQYALQINHEKTMRIVRQKPYYFLLSQEQKEYVEQTYKSDPRSVGVILSLAQDEIIGLRSINYLDTDAIQDGTYPWKEDLWDIGQIRNPQPDIKVGSFVPADTWRSIRKSRDRK